MGNSASHSVRVYNYMTNQNVVAAYSYDNDDLVQLVAADSCYGIAANGGYCTLDCDANKCDINICKKSINGDCVKDTTKNNVGDDYMYIFQNYNYIITSDSKPNHDSFYIYNQNDMEGITVTLDVTQYDDLPDFTAGSVLEYTFDSYALQLFEPMITFGYIDLVFEIPTRDWEDDILFEYTGVSVSTDCGYYFDYNSKTGTATLEELPSDTCAEILA